MQWTFGGLHFYDDMDTGWYGKRTNQINIVLYRIFIFKSFRASYPYYAYIFCRNCYLFSVKDFAFLFLVKMQFVRMLNIWLHTQKGQCYAFSFTVEVGTRYRTANHVNFFFQTSRIVLIKLLRSSYKVWDKRSRLRSAKKRSRLRSAKICQGMTNIIQRSRKIRDGGACNSEIV